MTGEHKALKGIKILTEEIEYALNMIKDLLIILYDVEYSTQYEIPVKAENLGHKLHEQFNNSIPGFQEHPITSTTYKQGHEHREQDKK